jgi:hypothetical protein
LIERGAKIVDALEAEQSERAAQPRGASRLPIALPLWIGAAALIVIAAKLFFG